MTEQLGWSSPERWARLNDGQLEGANFALRAMHTSPRVNGQVLAMLKDLIDGTVAEMERRNKKDEERPAPKEERSFTVKREFHLRAIDDRPIDPDELFAFFTTDKLTALGRDLVRTLGLELVHGGGIGVTADHLKPKRGRR